MTSATLHERPKLQRRAAQATRLGAMLVAATLLTACDRSDAVVAPAPTPVRVATVSEGPAQPPIDVTGVVAARDELRLSFKLGGLVQHIAVREGDRVHKGQLLAQLDPTEIAAQVEQTRQMSDKAERDLARGAALHADQVIPLEQLQNLRTQADVARSQLRAARFNQQYASITAPTDGVVLRRLIGERELVAPGQAALLLGRNDNGYIVRFAVADRSIVQLRSGDPVELRLDAWPADIFKAAVSQIANAADPASGLFAVEARMDNTTRPLASGLVGRVRLWPQTVANATLPYVPIGAVLEGNDNHARVFVVDGDIARSRTIEVAFITADSVAVRNGVKPGEKVIAVGAPYVEDGGKIASAP
jgi:RND family efflux transporter MFP subunit